MKPGALTAMISSTSMDLPVHRSQVLNACLREEVFPIGMEQHPVQDAYPLQTDREMVDKADIYLLILAHRYGSVPEGYEKSYTEMEFERAVERGIPILVFVIHTDHPITIDMVEAGDLPQKRLADFKARACNGRIRGEFKSPDDLRGLVVQALADLGRRKEDAAGEKPAPNFHPPSNIPQAPKPYIAHPYVLLQTRSVIGRRKELHELTDWITKNEQVSADTRIFSVVAIGGMGKSALTWKWFEDIAPNEFPNLAGRMWWSFYESDAHWENFIIRALAYTAAVPEAEVRHLNSPEREDRLLRLLDERPFLLVLDGLERILLAYARIDAAYLPEDDLDQQTANTIATATGLPDQIRETYVEKHRFRQCADLRAGAFLRKLTRVRASRVLLSTRLYPAELQSQTAQPLPGCHAIFLQGLTDDDALALWRGFIGGERSGTSEQLLPLFRAFGNYPLFLRTLAGEVAQYRLAPGDFDRWRKDHPEFNPANLSLKNAKTHVLEFSLRALGEAQSQVLRTLAAFRMPTSWETLTALFAVEDESEAMLLALHQGHPMALDRKSNDGITHPLRMLLSRAFTDKTKVCFNERHLDEVMTELEDRGLVGWNKFANRYDLHPVVRSVVWKGLPSRERGEIHRKLNLYLQSLPATDQAKVDTIDELSVAIELYCNLIALQRFDDAFIVFRTRIEIAAIYRLSHTRLCAELLGMLFPEGLQNLPKLGSADFQFAVLNALAQCYQFSGEPGKAEPFFEAAITLIRRIASRILLHCCTIVLGHFA